MIAQRPRLTHAAIVVVALGLCCLVVVVGHAQLPGRSGEAAVSGQPNASATTAAEREQIWNSSNMLRARAWLRDYCSKSAKITPAMARKYETDLANMTPAQMKLWLLKFDEEEEQRQQRYATWQHAQSAALSQAMAADRATRQSYADINREENAAAGEAEQQVSEEKQFSQTEEENKQLEPVGPYGPWGYGGYGGIHYHFHLYPY